MRKRIGIASEGPTDFLVLKKVIDKITGEDNQYLPLQPEPDMMGRYGNGWKGVWKWCKETAPLNVLMDSIQPQIDMIVIQMDGDVVRKEKEVHCWCESTICKEKKSEVFPLYCRNTIERKCPIELPCSNHVNDLKDMIMHGKYVLGKTMGEFDKTKIVITIPCDSTDAWIVAAFEDYDNIEQIEDPWKNIIAKGKYYHGIRVRSDKKNVVTYGQLSEQLVDNWNMVTDRCISAKCLEDDIRKGFDLI